MKFGFGGIVFQVNTHRLTNQEIFYMTWSITLLGWRPWRFT